MPDNGLKGLRVWSHTLIAACRNNNDLIAYLFRITTIATDNPVNFGTNRFTDFQGPYNVHGHHSLGTAATD